MLFVTEDNPGDLDDQFIDEYPALGMKKTSNSGAFWGDGDLRATAIEYDALTFALESKARFSDRYVNCKPRAAEWVKAMGDDDSKGQLKKFDRSAIRLFLVYNSDLAEWAVSIPETDLTRLSDAGIEIPSHDIEYVRSGGQKHPYRLFDEWRFNDLYASIEAFRTS